MLDATPAGRLPSLADQIDVVASGLRQRLGTARIPGLHAGLVAAAPVAVALAAGISAFAWSRVEPLASGEYLRGAALFGVFRTLAPVAYACWLVVLAGWAVLRPTAVRLLIAASVLITLVLPAVSPLTTVERPPVWILMALTAFGLIALAGTAPAHGATRPSRDERLAVVCGAGAVAVGGWLLTPAAAPVGYYQSTVARVGIVVAASVAAVAIVALLRRGRTESLWATVLLGLPAGWLGPFTSPALLPDSPRFGRLAQVMLATCVAGAAVAWLARRRPSGLARAGAAALGAAAGLALFAGLASAGDLGFPAGPVPPYVWCGIAALGLAGLVAGGLHSGALAWAAAAVAGAYAVSAYDYHWTLRGWTDAGATLGLVIVLALPPLAACAYAAAAAPPGPRRPVVLAISLGWIGYVALPYVRSWGPVILVLAACALALHASASVRHRRQPSR
jgi:hypothetical protein